MMQLAIVLLVIGVVSLVAEMFLAGADFGIAGIVGLGALIAAGVVFVVFVPGGIFYALAMAFLVISGIVIFFKSASKRGILKKLVMDDVLGEDADGTVDLSGFEGKSGVTVTPMRPIGTVDFGGVPVEAYSDGAFIGKGEKVVVTNFEGTKLFVRPTEAAQGPNRRGAARLQ